MEYSGTIQARAFHEKVPVHLTRTFQAEVDEGFVSETEAISLATLFMQSNQLDCFQVAEKRMVSL
jgi:hypothetical protein